ncbi:MAG: HlyD family secretion protein [Deltaproteobacteria bacterium]|nr:HlyD family secretion protein [Deltaproteobacteria bacterium]MBW2134583.1 HlyD family secretion protein [Deltaproteobacteria bacterium]
MVEKEPTSKKTGGKTKKIVILVVILLLAVGGGVAYWWYSRIYVWTDNAYVSGHLAVISPRVSGRVAEVLVSDNWFVSQGQTLVRLDPTDFEVAVQQSQAALERIRDEVAQKYIAVAAAQAHIAKAQANFGKATTDQNRYQNLYQRRTISKETLDRTQTNYKVTRAELAAAKEEYRQALAAIGGSVKIPKEEQPAVKEAQAKLQQARLNLQYTTITAPFEGYVTKKNVEPGNWVNPGQALMMLVPLEYEEVWIEANYKETQLTHVHLGQPAEIEVDTYPGVTFRGRVDSIMAGTGAVFSLLPAENATGNWVKVVQRIPVKITLVPPIPKDRPLRIGMSVIATIDTRDRTGPRLLNRQLQKLGKLPKLSAR